MVLRFLFQLQAKIICNVEATDLNAENTPGKINCFDEELDATECKDIKVKLKYKIINADKNVDMTIVADKTSFFFNTLNVTSLVKPALENGALVPSGEGASFVYSTTINTCHGVYLAEMTMKLKSSEGEIRTDRCKFKVRNHTNIC